MKNFILVLVFATMVFLVSCGGTNWQRHSLVDYTYDQQKKQLVPTDRQEVVGAPDPATQQLLLAQKILAMAENMTDKTAQLAVIEMVGRYYLPEGYGEKRVDSYDGTVAASVIGSNSPTADNDGPYHAETIPGAYYYDGWFFLNEDSLRVSPISPTTAKKAWADPDIKKIEIDIINSRLK